jgi:hypothetical protein
MPYHGNNKYCNSRFEDTILQYQIEPLCLRSARSQCAVNTKRGFYFNYYHLVPVPVVATPILRMTLAPQLNHFAQCPKTKLRKHGLRTILQQFVHVY